MLTICHFSRVKHALQKAALVTLVSAFGLSTASSALAVTNRQDVCRAQHCIATTVPTTCPSGTTCVVYSATTPSLMDTCAGEGTNAITAGNEGRCLTTAQQTCANSIDCLALDVGAVPASGAPTPPAKVCGYRCDDASGNAVTGWDRVHACSTPADCTSDCNTMCPRLAAGSRCHTASTPAAERIRCVDNAEHRVATADPPTTVAPPAQGGSTVQTSGGGSTRGTSATLINPLGGVTDFRQLIARLVRAAIGLVGSIALAVFIYGGILYMTARGDANQVKTARGVLVQAFIGLMLIFFSYTIASAFLEAFVTTARMGSNVPITNPAP